MSHKKYILTWCTKYRRSVLIGPAGLRIRELIRALCAELQVEILPGSAVRKDHIKLIVHVPADLPLPTMVRIVKSKSARAMFQESTKIQGAYPRRSLWQRCYFAQQLPL